MTTIDKPATREAALQDALEELMRTSRAVVGADLKDSRSSDAYDMYQAARNKARAALRAPAVPQEPVALTEYEKGVLNSARTTKIASDQAALLIASLLDIIERVAAAPVAVPQAGYLMQCRSCGTVSDTGRCDCTKFADTAHKRDAAPFSMEDLKACIAVPQAGEWLPIETAPDVGEKVWVFGGPYEKPMLVIPCGIQWRLGKDVGKSVPTHWLRQMPPAPPSASYTEEQPR